jgi:hypothetical protein
MATDTDDSFTGEMLEPLMRLDKDIKKAASLMNGESVRSAVTLYYHIQGFRIRAKSKVTSAPEESPDKVLSWVFENTRRLEEDIKKILGEFAAGYTVGKWLQSICGIGPVISAGLLANLDIRTAKTAGQWWRFAGLDPTLTWVGREKSKDLVKRALNESGGLDAKGISLISKESGQHAANIINVWEHGFKPVVGEKAKAGKAGLEAWLSRRPYNADLKTLTAFKLGECFVKVKGNAKDFYGKIYEQRKAFECSQNDAGAYKEEAEKMLSQRKYGKETEAYKAYSLGRLSAGHIHARCRRYAVKLFLSHLHHVMHEDFYGAPPPVPYIMSKADTKHTHFIKPPNWPMLEPAKPLSHLYRQTNHPTGVAPKLGAYQGDPEAQD